MDFEKLKTEILRDEGKSRLPYKDTKGILTIGIGRNLERGITDDEIFYLFGNDIRSVVRDMDHHIKWWRDMPEPCQRALANMCFNMGWPTLSTFKRMIAALVKRDYGMASAESLDSNWAEQVGDRAVRISELFLEGEAP